MYKLILIVIILFPMVSFSAEGTPLDPVFEHARYIGIQGGYGGTTWQGLVPTDKTQNEILSLSTPIDVHENGAVWGAFAGYEVSPYFALEMNYIRYPSAHIYFDEYSLYSFENDGLTELYSQTQTIALQAKVMLIVPKTHVRVFSSAGVADVEREDPINKLWRISPAFSFGINDNLTPHIMVELAGNYIAGYGESELNPVNDFIPFLYSVDLKVAYRF